MSETYSIPHTPSACFDFQNTTLDYCKTNKQRLQIPEEKLTLAVGIQTTYVAAYHLAAEPSTRSPQATADRDQKWDQLREVLVDIYNHYLINNPVLTDADRTVLHINTMGGRVTTYAAPASAPIITLVTEEASALRIIYSDPSASGSHYKPDGVAFCELCYKVGDPAPASPGECNERFNISRSHDALPFDQTQRGKQVYIYARWVNKNGKTGSWGNMVGGLIP